MYVGMTVEFKKQQSYGKDAVVNLYRGVRAVLYSLIMLVLFPVTCLSSPFLFCGKRIVSLCSCWTSKDDTFELDQKDLQYAERVSGKRRPGGVFVRF